MEEELNELRRRREEDWKDLHIDTYAGQVYYNAKDGNELLAHTIISGEPCLVARLGETETRTVNMYLRRRVGIKEFLNTIDNICVNAGFFPKNPIRIGEFVELYKNSLDMADYVGIMLWDDEELLLSSSECFKGGFPSAILDACYNAVNLEGKTWTRALEGKKVLVIHPFAVSIEKQYNLHREELFPLYRDVLPEYNLFTVKSVQSIGGRGAKGYKNWFDALEHMKKQIDEVDFDIALLGCGAYGIPLGAHIKAMGKQAIYVGGCLQLMYGILGKRWDDSEYIQKLRNEKWIRPSEDEKPEHFDKVEDGCYW